MLDFLRKLVEGAPAPAPIRPAEAVAALLIETATADGRYAEGEARLVERALAALFDLDATGAAAMRAAGEAAQRDAVDLVRFTRIVKTALDEAERVALIEALWAVVLADGVRDPHEDALLRKLAPLIAVSDRDSAEARRRAAARRGG
jgi:uncharacterized tellurite resistance protein B-like protein